MQPEAQFKIIAKLHAIQKDVKAMSKEGVNEFQRYKYLMEAQVAEQFKGLLEKHGVVFVTSSKITDTFTPTTSGMKQTLTNVTVDYAFIDVESGQKFTGCAAGQGTDSGDKGVYKAITGAVKYIFMKNFLIPTGDDPENERAPRGVGKGVPAKKVNLEKPPFDDDPKNENNDKIDED